MIDQPKNILLVEDEPIIAFMESTQLQTMGYHIQYTINGEQAIEMVSNNNNH